VPDEFDCQAHCLSREFIYRLIIPKSNIPAPGGLFSIMPISELGRSHFLLNQNIEFNIENAAQGCLALASEHDFATFCHDNQVSKIRTIEEFAVTKLNLEAHEEFDQHYKNVDIYEFYVRGKSFLNGQILKMASCITSLAIGNMSLCELKRVVADASPANWKDSHLNLTPNGLYLLGVHYDSDDLVFGKTKKAPPLEEDDYDLEFSAKEDLEEAEEEKQQSS